MRFGGTICIYTRFFLHAISDGEQVKLIEWLASNLTIGDMVACEYRNDGDFGRHKETETHFRRFINDKDLIDNLSLAGFKVAYHVTGIGYAKYKADDASVTMMLP